MAPRSGSGISGSGGRCRIATELVTVSGTVDIQFRQARSTVAASSNRKVRPPPYSVRIGNSRKVICVTIPKAAPPPSRARNSSGSFSGVTRRRVASAVTTSMAVTWSAAKPYVRAIGPRPPPSV